MEKRATFYIYGRREMAVLFFLAVLIAAFSFTLGVHLGKKVIPDSPGPVDNYQHASEHDTGVKSVPDEAPDRHEMADHVKKEDELSDDTLDKSLHGEVTKQGLRVDTPLQVELPDQTKAEAGAGASLGKKTVGDLKNVPLLQRPAPSGKFTLQIGSYKTLEEAQNRIELLEATGRRSFVRSAQVGGQEWYRVFVGGHETRADAEESGAKLKSEQLLDGFVVTKMP